MHSDSNEKHYYNIREQIRDGQRHVSKLFSSILSSKNILTAQYVASYVKK